ncbi:MAG: restriction endonuclease [Holophagales bacterium]|nr:restriction endonuclease [Holophagales bacterium]
MIWDLDVEAPGLHRLRALRSEGSVETGFFDWLIAWQTGGYKDPGPDELAAFVSAIRSTPFSDLALLPAHGDDANPGTLYASIDWARWLADEPTIGRDLLTRLLGHLGEQGYRHVLLDARTGLTDLGGLLAGVIPDATILVGGYGAQNLGGLGLVVERLRREDDEAEKGFRAGRPKPRLFLIASPIPQNDAKLRAAGQELWRSTFGPSESAHEIPFDPALPFSEELLITKPGLRIAEAYEKPVRDLAAFAETVETDFEKGEEEVRARPDLFDGLHPRLSRANREKRFEELVAELLRLLGYTVELEQLIDSNKVDLLARIQVGVDENTYLVECKDHEKAGGKETVEKLHGWLGQPRARSLGARGMVVARGFSPAAITYAKEQGIKTLTAEDLERQLVDFGRYLDDLIRRFEQSPLAASYVTQRSRPGATPDKVIEDLAAYGARWANGIGNRLWVLLGDYGTGKTAFSEKLAYDLAKQARGDFSKPIPFLINLRDVPNKASLDEVLHEHWARATGQRKDPRLFLHLVGRGRLVLLLDSFDEMGIATAGRSVVEQLRNLVKLTGEAGETSQANRVLVTCREQFFREHGEALKAARGETDSISPHERRPELRWRHRHARTVHSQADRGVPGQAPREERGGKGAESPEGEVPRLPGRPAAAPGDDH